MFHVYILKLANGKFYIGQTNNLANRMQRHSTAQVRATKGFLPATLIYSESFASRAEAMSRETYLKSLKSHKAVADIIARNNLASSNG